MHLKASEVKNRKTLGIPLNENTIAINREQIGKHDEFVFVYQSAEIGGLPPVSQVLRFPPFVGS